MNGLTDSTSTATGVEGQPREGQSLKADMDSARLRLPTKASMDQYS